MGRRYIYVLLATLILQAGFAEHSPGLARVPVEDAEIAAKGMWKWFFGFFEREHIPVRPPKANPEDLIPGPTIPPTRGPTLPPAFVPKLDDPKYKGVFDRASSAQDRADFARRFPKPFSLDSRENIVATPPPVDGFAVIPTDRLSWTKVFGSEPDPADLSSAQSVETQLQKISISPLNAPSTTVQFKSMVAQSKSSVFVIVGHNVGGNLIVPPNHYLSLQEMSNSCSELMRMCIFFSCRAGQYGVEMGARRELNFSDAQQLASEVERLASYAISHGKTNGQLTSAIPVLLDQVEIKQSVRASLVYIPPLVVVGSVGLIVVYAGPFQSK